MVTSPYASQPQQPGQYGTYVQYADEPSQAYVPESGNTEYIYPLGWSVNLRREIGNTPDPQRELMERTYTVRPDGNETPQAFYGPIDANTRARESVTDTQAVGWSELKSQYVMGPDPRWNPPMESRVTSSMSPASYSFQRPFDQLAKGNGAREFNGQHFSMADHRRNYPIAGMGAAQSGRNTYRASPAPWDANMYDAVPAQDLTNGVVQTIQAPSSTKSYRL